MERLFWLPVLPASLAETAATISPLHITDVQIPCVSPSDRLGRHSFKNKVFIIINFKSTASDVEGG